MVDEAPQARAATGSGAQESNETLHVAHVIDELPPDGAERLLADLLTVRSPDIRYSVLCIDQEGELATEIRSLGVPVELIGRQGRVDVSLPRRLGRWFKKNRVSVVHTHLFTADAYGRLAAYLNHVPAIVSTVHSTNDWKGSVHRFVDRLLSRVTGAVVACTDQVARVLVERDGIHPGRVLTIRNGVHENRVSSGQRKRLRDEWGIRSDEVLVGVAGRLHPAKGQSVFLQSVAALSQKLPGVRGVLIGSGPLENELRSECVRLGLGDRVLFAGQRRDMADVFAALDILAMPSAWEGLPITLLEGMACKLAVVASEVGGIPDVLAHNVNGLMCPPADSAAFTQVLGELVSDPVRRATLGQNARATIRERFNIAATLREYEALYERLLAERGRPAVRSGRVSC